MYTVIDIRARRLRPGLHLSEAELSFARAVDPVKSVSAKIHDCDNDLPANFPVISFGRDYEVCAVPEGLRLRAASAGFRAEHALRRAFDDDTCIEVAIPVWKKSRHLRDALVMLKAGVPDFRINQTGRIFFRDLFPTRITDVRLSRILREHLPRVYVPAPITHCHYATV